MGELLTCVRNVPGCRRWRRRYADANLERAAKLIESFKQVAVDRHIVVNAVTHGFDGRTNGVIRIEAAAAGADHCCITLADDGKGMPPEVAARVFEPFFTTCRGRGGSGLGLRIVWNLVTQRLGGSIRCSSTPGEGSAFVITLPVRPSSPA